MRRVKIVGTLLIILTLTACGVPDFEDAYEAEDHIIKGIMDGDIDYKKLMNVYATENAEVDEIQFDRYKKIAENKLTKDIYEMQGDDLTLKYNYKYKDGPGLVDAHINFVYEDGTYKVNKIFVLETRE